MDIGGQTDKLRQISVTYMAGYSDLIPRRERLAAAQDIMLYDHQSLGAGEMARKVAQYQGIRAYLPDNHWFGRLAYDRLPITF